MVIFNTQPAFVVQLLGYITSLHLQLWQQLANNIIFRDCKWIVWFSGKCLHFLHSVFLFFRLCMQFADTVCWSLKPHFHCKLLLEPGLARLILQMKVSLETLSAFSISGWRYQHTQTKIFTTNQGRETWPPKNNNHSAGCAMSKMAN